MYIMYNINILNIYVTEMKLIYMYIHLYDVD